MGIDLQDFADFPSGRTAEYQPLPTCSRADPADVLLDAKDVAEWLHVTEDWVWDHASRRAPFLPAIWLSEGALRFKRSKIVEFIDERERLSTKHRKRR
jgi:predicted DNA-binding transcriptional regulator AlpA